MQSQCQRLASASAAAVPSASRIRYASTRTLKPITLLSFKGNGFRLISSSHATYSIDKSNSISECLRRTCIQHPMILAEFHSSKIHSQKRSFGILHSHSNPYSHHSNSKNTSFGNGSFFSTSTKDKDEKEGDTDATVDKEETTDETPSKPKSLRDAVNRLQDKESDPNSESTSDTTTESKNEILDKLSSSFASFASAVSSTWEELIESSKPKDINKSIISKHVSKPGSASDDDNEAADKYQGTMAIMVIDEEENLGAFERIQKRLSEAPIIQDIMGKTEELYEKSGAKKAKHKIDHIAEDAREAWETSQNPWVYRISSVYDTLTAESEYAATERELRTLDPDFSLEKWKEDVVEVTLPKFMSQFLEGRIKELKPRLGEAVYNRLAAEARARKKEGVYVDTNILGIMNSEILSCNPDPVDKSAAPIIVLHFMVQQINCVRKKEGGEIVEGSEDDIRAYSYVAAFQREYDEEKGELNWKIVDFMLNGAIAYL